MKNKSENELVALARDMARSLERIEKKLDPGKKRESKESGVHKLRE